MAYLQRSGWSCGVLRTRGDQPFEVLASHKSMNGVLRTRGDQPSWHRARIFRRQGAFSARARGSTPNRPSTGMAGGFAGVLRTHLRINRSVETLRLLDFGVLRTRGDQRNSPPSHDPGDGVLRTPRGINRPCSELHIGGRAARAFSRTRGDQPTQTSRGTLAGRSAFSARAGIEQPSLPAWLLDCFASLAMTWRPRRKHRPVSREDVSCDNAIRDRVGVRFKAFSARARINRR